jgi:hypothetical protein
MRRRRSTTVAATFGLLVSIPVFLAASHVFIIWFLDFWDFRCPLNRLVDIAHPDSDEARHFRAAVQTYARSDSWHDNDARLHPPLQQSFLLNELKPLSEDLSALASAGLFALNYLGQSTPSPNSWREQQLALLERAETPKADLLLMVVEPARQLIEASGGQTR